jgi:hypothetical protein
MKNLLQKIKQLEAHVANLDKENKSISDANIGWHIHHSLLTIESIIRALVLSNPDEFKGKFNKWKTMVFLLGKIPRGKGKAPDRVKPREKTNPTLLNELFTQVHTGLATLESLPANSFFAHPYFGMLHKNETIKFLNIHTKHHLKIIEDIIKA